MVDLADRLPVSRPAVSQHLKILKEAGLVRDVQVGTRRVYSLDPDGLVRAAGLPRALLADGAALVQDPSRKREPRERKKEIPVADVQTAVSTSIVVDAPVERAFAVFTEDMGSWWPPEHHILQAPLARMVFEPKVGGQIYDVGTDGSECHWARVLAYEPPHRIVFSWEISHAVADRDRSGEGE